MKKIIIFFIVLFMFIASPVNALDINNNVNNEVQYKLEKDNKDNDKDKESGSNIAFWGMLAVAFLAISVFIIAYKSDDGMPDD